MTDLPVLIPELKAFENYVLTFELDASSDGSINNTVTVDDTFGPNSANWETDVIPAADLSISQSAKQEISGTTTYSINIDNLGPSAAENITVTDIYHWQYLGNNHYY